MHNAIVFLEKKNNHYARTAILIIAWAIRSTKKKKKMCADHVNDVRVGGVHQYAPAGRNIFYQFVESGPLHLFTLQISDRVKEVKEHTALLKLLHKQLLLLCWRSIWNMETIQLNLVNLRLKWKKKNAFIMSYSDVIYHYSKHRTLHCLSIICLLCCLWTICSIVVFIFSTIPCYN